MVSFGGGWGGGGGGRGRGGQADGALFSRQAAAAAAAAAALTQGLERIPDQTGYLVICDGAVLAVRSRGGRAGVGAGAGGR